MADIFLSYAEEDRPIAARIAALLESAGWSVWWDRKIAAGKTWRDVLEQALQNMRCMVVLWSSHSIKSEWVKEEAEEGRTQRKLIPILIEPVIPPVGFRSFQAADFTGWDGSSEFFAARQLVVDLEALLGEPARPGVALNSPPTISWSTSSTNRKEAISRSGLELASRWCRQTRWRSLAGSVAVVTLLITAPLSHRSAVDVESTVSNPMPQIDPGAAIKPLPGEIRVYAPAADPVEGSMPTSGIIDPARRPANMRAAAPQAKATAISNARSVDPRCREILDRVQLGEPLSEENQALLQKECR